MVLKFCGSTIALLEEDYFTELDLGASPTGDKTLELFFILTANLMIKE